MRLVIRPGGGVRGQVRVPGDKSISHRALMLGAIAEGQSRIEGFLPARDCLATLRCLRALGIKVKRLDETSLVVYGQGLHGLREPRRVLRAAGSATTMRLLAGILAGQPFYSVITGHSSLLRRPMDRIVTPLRQMGALIFGREGDRFPPLTIRGGDLKGIDYAMPMASAQVKSCILLAGLYADGITRVREPGPARDHTERMLRARGVDLRVQGREITLRPPEKVEAMDVAIPGDFSSAAFLVVASCLAPGSEVLVKRVGVNPTRTGLWDVLERMGMVGRVENRHQVGGELVAHILVTTSSLMGAEVGRGEIPRLIDEVPILAVAASQAEGRTVVRGAAELRLKESDRIATTVSELRKLGAQIEETADGFIIEGPTKLKGAYCDSHGDHRLAMALAIAGLIAERETVIEGAECISDSFPGFLQLLEGLRRRQHSIWVEE